MAMLGMVNCYSQYFVTWPVDTQASKVGDNRGLLEDGPVCWMYGNRNMDKVSVGNCFKLHPLSEISCLLEQIAICVKKIVHNTRWTPSGEWMLDAILCTFYQGRIRFD